jgi:hypothetical protein
MPSKNTVLVKVQVWLPIDGGGRGEVRNRLVRAPQSLHRDAQIVAAVGGIRIERHRPLEVLRGSPHVALK